jgi:sulfur carrier protein
MSDESRASRDRERTIMVRVNGNAMQCAPGTTLRSLIESLGMGKQAVAVEVGGKLVPHREHATRTLSEGEVVELVSLVGGG